MITWSDACLGGGADIVAGGCGERKEITSALTEWSRLSGTTFRSDKQGCLHLVGPNARDGEPVDKVKLGGCGALSDGRPHTVHFKSRRWRGKDRLWGKLSQRKVNIVRCHHCRYRTSLNYRHSGRRARWSQARDVSRSSCCIIIAGQGLLTR